MVKLTLQKVKEELEKLESLEEKKEYLEKILDEVKGKSKAAVEQMLKDVEEFIKKTQIKDSLEQKMITEIPAPSLPAETPAFPEIKYTRLTKQAPSPLEEEVKPARREEGALKYAAITPLYETEALKTALTHTGIVKSNQFLEGIEALKKYQKAAAYELAKERWPGKTEEELGRVVRATFGEKLEYERMREEREERAHPKKYKSVRAQERG